MIRRPPRSTLFPYTTLFRSLGALARVFLMADSSILDGNRLPHRGQFCGLRTPARVVLRGGPPDKTTLAGVLKDRKSTRLNSSHSQISYAVFCLKKKKKNETVNWIIHVTSPTEVLNFRCDELLGECYDHDHTF